MLQVYQCDATWSSIDSYGPIWFLEGLKGPRGHAMLSPHYDLLHWSAGFGLRQMQKGGKAVSAPKVERPPAPWAAVRGHGRNKWSSYAWHGPNVKGQTTVDESVPCSGWAVVRVLLVQGAALLDILSSKAVRPKETWDLWEGH